MMRLRHFPLIMASLVLAASAPASAAPKPFLGPEVDLGNPKAPITVIEYGSASCPHCARFNNNVFPAFKAKYIDTGKVHFIFREFLTDPAEFAAAAFLMSRCAGRDKYLPILDAVFQNQDKIFHSGDLPGGLLAVGQGFGLSKADEEACIHDPAAQKALEARVTQARTDGIDGTPTFLINKERVEGETTLGDLMLVIEPMLAAMAVNGH